MPSFCRLSLVGAFALCTAFPVFADEEYEARLAVAKEYVQLTMDDLDMPALIRQMWTPVAEQYAAQGTPLSDAQKQLLDDLYQREMTGPMREILVQQDRVIAETLTLDEITALRDFYRSEIGRSVMKKLPDMLAKQQPQVIEMVQAQLPKLLPELYKILDVKN